jgi:hypothetical protein
MLAKFPTLRCSDGLLSDVLFAITNRMRQLPNRPMVENVCGGGSGHKHRATYMPHELMKLTKDSLKGGGHDLT